MMDFNELRRLTELLKTLKALQTQREVLAWMEENRDSIRGLEPAQLEELREKADYDKEAWAELLRQLLK